MVKVSLYKRGRILIIEEEWFIFIVYFKGKNLLFIIEYYQILSEFLFKFVVFTNYYFSLLLLSLSIIYGIDDENMRLILIYLGYYYFIGQ